MEEMKYRKLLADIGRNIRDDELKSIKFMCAGLGIPARRMEEIENALDLWIVLQEKDCLDKDNLQLLKDLLEGREDLLIMISNYERDDESNTPREPVLNVNNSTANDRQSSGLDVEFDYVCTNIGKDWKKLGRVFGFGEADFSAFEEQNPKDLFERVRLMLNTWATRGEPKEREDLIEKLQKAKFNMIAYHIKTLESQSS